MFTLASTDALTWEAQDQFQKELEEEQAKNQDDIAHHEMLQQHYDEREKLYEVSATRLVGNYLKVDFLL